MFAAGERGQTAAGGPPEEAPVCVGAARDVVYPLMDSLLAIARRSEGCYCILWCKAGGRIRRPEEDDGTVEPVFEQARGGGRGDGPCRHQR